MSISEWISNSYPLGPFGFVATCAVLFLVIYIIVKERKRIKHEQQITSEQPIQPNAFMEGMSIPQSNNPTIPFKEMHNIENENLDYLKNMLRYTEKEIELENETFIKAKEQYTEATNVGNRIKAHLPFLERQRDMLKNQIEKK